MMGESVADDIVIATVSFSVGCASSYPEVGSRTSASVGFVRDTMREESSSPPPDLLCGQPFDVSEEPLPSPTLPPRDNAPTRPPVGAPLTLPSPRPSPRPSPQPSTRSPSAFPTVAMSSISPLSVPSVGPHSNSPSSNMPSPWPTGSHTSTPTMVPSLLFSMPTG